MRDDANGPGEKTPPNGEGAGEDPTPPQGTTGEATTPAVSPPAAPVSPQASRRSPHSVVLGIGLVVVGVVGLVLTLRSGRQAAPPPVESTAKSAATAAGHFTSTVRSASGNCQSNPDAKPGRATRSDGQVTVSGDQITIEDGPTVASGPIGSTGTITARSSDGTRSWVGTITGTKGQGKSFLVAGNAADPANSCTIEFTFTVTLDRALR